MTNFASITATLSTKELLAVYNKLASKPVERFSDKKAGERRLTQLVETKGITLAAFQEAVGAIRATAPVNGLHTRIKAKTTKEKVEELVTKTNLTPVAALAQVQEEAKQPVVTEEGKRLIQALRNLLYNYNEEPGFSDVTVDDLAKELMCNPVSTARIFDRLIELGLVVREKVKINNKPAEFHSFTAKGREYVETNGITSKKVSPKNLASKPVIEVITDKADAKALAALEKEQAAKAKKALKAPVPSALAKNLKETGITAPKAKTPPAPKAPRPEGEAPAKQNTPPHLNLRCPSCGYYAKSTPDMLAIARLACPVNSKHGILLTKEERGENRGR